LQGVVVGWHFALVASGPGRVRERERMNGSVCVCFCCVSAVEGRDVLLFTCVVRERDVERQPEVDRRSYGRTIVIRRFERGPKLTCERS
jgi:hypothetical protein